MYFIGIDIGTSSICGVVFDDSGQQHKVINTPNEFNIASDLLWEKAQDPEKIVSRVWEIVHKFESAYAGIEGIAVTGQMHGILYVNDQGRSVSPLYTWRDSRGGLIYRNGQTYAAYLTEKTGYKLSPGFGLVTHFYNIRNRLVPADAGKLCTIMDYVVMRLSGSKAPLMDYTNGASLGFFNLRQNQFDKEVLGSMGIDPGILPDVKDSGSRAGYHNQIPVFSALGDNQASFIGAVKDRQNAIHITIGTSSQLSIYSKEYVYIDGLDTRPFPGGGYLLVGAGLSGGLSLEILKTFFERSVKLFFKDKAVNSDFYEILNSISLREKEALTVSTVFSGTRLDSSVRGSISNISATNFYPENLIRGFVRGIGNELYDFYKAVPDCLKKDKVRIAGSGNALERNLVLRSALEETFGLPVQCSSYAEEAASGAAFLAMQRGA